MDDETKKQIKEILCMLGTVACAIVISILAIGGM
jgi:hypothetical protein